MIQAKNISIHAPPRGATGNTYALMIPDLFQFTPLREGRPGCGARHQKPRDFNSRPSARGDHQVAAEKDGQQRFQFTPLREGRHQPSRRASPPSISIHAPPRGATSLGQAARPCGIFQFTPLREGRLFLRKSRRRSGTISIHAPPRGATIAGNAATADATNFNSRPSARGDGKRYAISANLLFNPYKSAWLNNSATQFVEIILVIFHRIIV